jgi:phosphopantothenoylcysteine decarboxylase/phosphopantothenate--cysteine ligase
LRAKEVVLGITGSIAAYKACDLVRLYRRKGFNVSCVMTREAEAFITPLTLESLSGNKVYTDMFALPENRTPQHVSLGDRADIIVICPASANVIGKLANGICDDLLTCTCMASTAPVLVAPAMNTNMYANKMVLKNVETLKRSGINLSARSKAGWPRVCTGWAIWRMLMIYFASSIKIIK